MDIIYNNLKAYKIAHANFIVQKQGLLGNNTNNSLPIFREVLKNFNSTTARVTIPSWEINSRQAILINRKITEALITWNDKLTSSETNTTKSLTTKKDYTFIITTPEATKISTEAKQTEYIK